MVEKKGNICGYGNTDSEREFWLPKSTVDNGRGSEWPSVTRCTRRGAGNDTSIATECLAATATQGSAGIDMRR